MSLLPYQQYSSSRVDPLPPLPSSWSVVPLKAAVRANQEVLGESTPPDFELAYVDIGNVDSVGGITGYETFRFSDAPSRARRLVRHGDVIVSTVRTYLRASARIRHPEENLVVSTGFAVLRPSEQMHSDYLGWVVQCEPFVDAVVARSTGISYPSITSTELLRIPVPVPQGAEQQAISKFLDRETARIDTLIAEQERLIALLQEKRQAVISHAVTKGLDPNVQLKDSGVEWMGAIPSHWSIARIGRAFRSIGSGSTPPSDNASYYDDNGVEWVNTGDLPDGPINSVARRVSSEAISKFTTLREYPAGAVVIAMYGATIGKLGILTRPAVVNQACCVLSEGDGVAEPFLFYALLAAREAIILLATGGTQPNISQATVRAFSIPVPPIEEQFSVVAQLEAALSKLNALSTDAEAMITLLRERRTALITAAVTGQIDVRGLVETAA